MRCGEAKTAAVRWIGIALLIFAGVGAPARFGLSPETTAPDPNDAALVARGKTLYDEHCAACHGAKLEGQPNWRHRLPDGRLPAPPHDRTGHTWHHSDKQLFDMTKFGTAALAPGYRSDMPGFADKLSDGDIWAVLSYIVSTWPPEIRAKQQHLNHAH
jgi:mono/diheme cytochrome c family protein